MLSDMQEGFRKGFNTLRQARNLINALEDAATYGNNIYTVYVYFASAFNMVDQDKLLQIMYDLGVSEHIIDIIKHIYTDNTTRIKARELDAAPS